MKKIVLSILLFAVFCSLSTAQKTFSLDEAIIHVASELAVRLPPRTKVVLYEVEAETPEAQSYIADELTYKIFEQGSLLVIDRKNLDALRTELSFQVSGDVSDESAQRLGAMLGAETLIFCTFELLKGSYRLAIKAIKVETAEIQYLANLDVAISSKTESLSGKKTATETAVSAVGSAAKSFFDFTGRFLCMTINPVFGIGSYIQGDTSGGGTVAFWEVVGAGTFWYGTIRQNRNEKWGSELTVAGGIMAGGAVVYSLIRPWTYNRAPKVTAVLDNVQIVQTSASSINVGYRLKY